jgi:hypothetical protein
VDQVSTIDASSAMGPGNAIVQTLVPILRFVWRFRRPLLIAAIVGLILKRFYVMAPWGSPNKGPICRHLPFTLMNNPA